MAGWRCTLNDNHVWESQISSRALDGRLCPYHMRVNVHPGESLAKFYPDLAIEWHSSRKGLRPEQVTHASAEMVDMASLRTEARMEDACVLAHHRRYRLHSASHSRIRP